MGVMSDSCAIGVRLSARMCRGQKPTHTIAAAISMGNTNAQRSHHEASAPSDVPILGSNRRPMLRGLGRGDDW